MPEQSEGERVPSDIEDVTPGWNARVAGRLQGALQRCALRDDIRRILVDGERGPQTGRVHALGRCMDLLIATLALILVAPLLAVVACLVALECSGPVLFRHARIGRGGQTFQVLKFRTMHVDGDAILRDHLFENEAARQEWALDRKLRRDPRVSQLGSLLRKSSLDELPQLVNVLRGEMSIVGPRPIVAAEVQRYGSFFRAYCSVRPGITGVWQVSGRNDISYRRRVAMDALYARKKSVLFDLQLIAATIPAVLSRRGSY